MTTHFSHKLLLADILGQSRSRSNWNLLADACNCSILVSVLFVAQIKMDIPEDIECRITLKDGTDIETDEELQLINETEILKIIRSDDKLSGTVIQTFF